MLADVVELAGEGVRRREQGSPERVEEGSGFGERRAGDEVVGERGGDGLIDRLLLEGGVFEELAEGGEGGVYVGEPEQKEFFESGFAIG